VISGKTIVICTNIVMKNAGRMPVVLSIKESKPDLRINTDIKVQMA
jgi:hypothetical protein